MVELPYGRVPYLLDLRGRDATIACAAERPSPPALAPLLDAALDAPIGGPRLEELVSAGTNVTIIVSDATRIEPRAELLAHLRARLPTAPWTLAIATGTHGPTSLDALGLPAHLLRDARIVNHDGHADADLVTIGTTSRGTPVRLHRCVVETDLIVATGCIQPHYFAGFGAGVKAIFPGLGAASSIRRNHALKIEPLSRAGIIDGNPCRDDLEEAVGLLGTPAFLLNGVCAPDLRVHAAVAGDLRAAFRAGVELARPWFTVRAPRVPLVIASDALPVTASLYQAAKVAAAVAPLVAPGGTLVLVAECPDGIGPLDVVNEAIFRIGVLPRLALGVKIELVSSLSPDEVSRTLLSHAPSVEDILRRVPGPVVVVPHASRLLFDPDLESDESFS
ncbi:MAG TPA: lactate racemase domain-containing protein [Kofleriaceae bacterium]|nr:lactate racemase domain-containing protein [Kofleriaceae bacterium]